MTTLTDAQIAGLAAGAGFPASEVPRAVAIALAESGGRTDAVGHNLNGSTDTGVWQINSIHGIPSSTLLDPVQNAQAAFNIWKAAGNSWQPWSTFTSGAYLPFMGRGNAAAGNPDSSANGNTQAGGGGSGPSDGTASAADSLSKITMGGFWLRVGAFLLGTILLSMGIMRMMGVNQTIVRFAKDAAEAAVVAA